MVLVILVKVVLVRWLVVVLVFIKNIGCFNIVCLKVCFFCVLVCVFMVVMKWVSKLWKLMMVF